MILESDQKSADLGGAKWASWLPLLSLFLIFRVWLLIKHHALWEDEMFSVTLAEQPWVDTIVATIRFDLHPPLYYLQLGLWGLISHSDKWYMLNSIVWNLASVIVLRSVVARRFDTSAGWLAAGIFIILPIEAYYAENARMYAMLQFFMIVAWYELDKATEERPDRHAWLIAGGVLVLAMYSHGLGVFCAAVLLLYQLVTLGYKRTLRGQLRPLLLLWAAIAIASAPLILNSLFRDTGHLGRADVQSAGETLAATFLGVLGSGDPGAYVLGLVATGLLALLLLTNRAARYIAFWLVMLPIAGMYLLTALGKPVFIFRSCGIFAPFLALSLALAVLRDWRSISAGKLSMLSLGLGGLLVAGFAVNSLRNIAVDERDAQNYTTAADVLKKNLQAGDVVVTFGGAHFWGLMREFAGANWGSALDYQPQPNAKYDALGKRIPARLLQASRFLGRSHEYQWQGHPILIGKDELPAAIRTASRVWVFGENRREIELAFQGGSHFPVFDQDVAHFHLAAFVGAQPTSSTGTQVLPQAAP